MAAVALIKFQQNSNIGANGQALIGVLGSSVTIQNSSNTNIASWEIILLYVPNGSSISTGLIASSNNSNTPSASIIPDVTGSYRFQLRVWDSVNRTGNPIDVDIRVFAVPEVRTGLIRPPYQAWPRPLPLIQSGEPGAKEDELNFSGQEFGWVGAEHSGLLDDTLKAIDNRIGISVGTSAITSGQVVFSNSPTVTFGAAGQTITASVSPNPSAGLDALAVGTNAITNGTVVFANANGLSFGINGNTVTGSYTVPQTTGFITKVNVAAGTTNNNLTNLSFADSNNISFGISNSTITASVKPPNRQISYLNCPENPWQTNFSISNASLSLQRLNPKADIIASQANLLMALKGDSDSSGGLTINLGVYRMNGSVLSLASSNSRVINWTSGSETTNSSVYGGISGTCYRSILLDNWSITAGDYMLGVHFKTGNNGTWRAFGQQGPTIVNAVDSNEINHFHPGVWGIAFGTQLMNGITVTDSNYIKTGGDALKQPGIIFMGSY